MIFSFKQKSQDFIVEEELPFQLSGKGDAFFVYFEKRNISTMDIIKFLCKELNISRLTLGIAGLKDKDAITRQRISIYKSALKKMGGENMFLNKLSEVTRIIETSWHTKPIGMTDKIKNTFHIRLRGSQKISQTEKEKTNQIIQNIFDKGFANYFGNQRFGIENRNPKQGKEIILGTLKIKESFDRKFKLQSYSSHIFNQYLLSRTKHGISILDGDLIQLNNKNFGVFQEKDRKIYTINQEKGNKSISYPQKTKEHINYSETYNGNITGPVPGFDLMLPEPQTASGRFEISFLESMSISSKELKIFQEHKIRGIRRKLRIYPENSRYRRQGDDILIDFTLEGGAYASIIIDQILKELGISK